MFFADSTTNLFSVARERQREIAEIWTNVSFRLGSNVPNSLLVVNVQRDGQLDILIRCIEDEFCPYSNDKGIEGIGMKLNELHNLSYYWICSTYQTLFAVNSRNKISNSNLKLAFKYSDFIRTILQKHEIPKDRQMKNQHLILQKQGEGANKEFIYDPGSNQKSHIGGSGLSPRGSILWRIIDLEKNESPWIERRWISDLILTAFDQGAQVSVGDTAEDKGQ